MRLTMTPPYLDPNSHKALYEIDLTLFEIGGQTQSEFDVPGESILAASASETRCGV